MKIGIDYNEAIPSMEVMNDHLCKLRDLKSLLFIEQPLRQIKQTCTWS